MDGARLLGVCRRAWALSAALWLPGCVVEVPSERQPHPCDDLACSDNGFCRDGECFCERGYLGNPYAIHGCQSTAPGSACGTTCGLNAWCDDGACVCEQGFVAICGTGDCLSLGQVCDGTPHCANQADEAPQTCAQQVVQQWSVVDECDDGVDVQWRLFSRDRDWAWPAADLVFVTDALGVSSHEEIECQKGERICFGGDADGLTWGVGIDGLAECDDCCLLCSEQPIDLGFVACE
ncbi:MAG: hypothetical protein K0V04_43275 [Deltaproteobacteria bacterium]|nr:hypothetical protein [Deltaproteobacteria bacterium]